MTLILLVSDEPLILYQLQQLAQVSRTTILKDLEAIETWIRTQGLIPVSYTHLRAHETVLDLVCRLLLEKKKK